VLLLQTPVETAERVVTPSSGRTQSSIIPDTSKRMLPLHNFTGLPIIWKCLEPPVTCARPGQLVADVAVHVGGGRQLPPPGQWGHIYTDAPRPHAV